MVRLKTVERQYRAEKGVKTAYRMILKKVEKKIKKLLTGGVDPLYSITRCGARNTAPQR